MIRANLIPAGAGMLDLDDYTYTRIQPSANTNVFTIPDAQEGDIYIWSISSTSADSPTITQSGVASVVYEFVSNQYFNGVLVAEGGSLTFGASNWSTSRSYTVHRLRKNNT